VLNFDLLSSDKATFDNIVKVYEQAKALHENTGFEVVVRSGFDFDPQTEVLSLIHNNCSLDKMDIFGEHLPDLGYASPLRRVCETNWDDCVTAYPDADPSIVVGNLAGGHEPGHVLGLPHPKDGVGIMGDEVDISNPSISFSPEHTNLLQENVMLPRGYTEIQPNVLYTEQECSKSSFVYHDSGGTPHLVIDDQGSINSPLAHHADNSDIFSVPTDAEFIVPLPEPDYNEPLRVANRTISDVSTIQSIGSNPPSCSGASSPDAFYSSVDTNNYEPTAFSSYSSGDQGVSESDASWFDWFFGESSGGGADPSAFGTSVGAGTNAASSVDPIGVASSVDPSSVAGVIDPGSVAGSIDFANLLSMLFEAGRKGFGLG